MRQDKRKVLLESLLRARRPMSGDELASQLQVTTRTLRTYVREINARSEVITSGHRGYSVDPHRYADLRQDWGRRTAVETPDQRQAYICRELGKRSTPVSVHSLAEDLSVSEATVEGDLTRARQLLANHDLVLKRDHEMLWLDGTEQSRRRLMRYILHATTEGLGPAAWQAFATEYAQLNVSQLKATVAKAIDASGLEFSEYAISDVVVHLAIAVERLSSGNPLTSTGWSPPLDDPAVLQLTRRLAGSVHAKFGTPLPDAEIESLYSMLAVRAVRGARESTAEEVVDPQVRETVRILLEQTAARYLLSPPDPSMLLNLALHVQNVLARAQAGQSLHNPLGDDFKNQHPLIHDIALYFAGRLEAEFDILLEPGEVDYLSFHMGTQFLRGLEQCDLVTITLVSPRYYDMADNLRDRLEDCVRGQAHVERVITTIDADFGAINSDIIVTCIGLNQAASTALVTISPFLTTDDCDQVLATVRHERKRIARRRMKVSLRSLITPEHFFRLKSLGSKEEALAIMCGQLAAAGYVEPSYLSNVLDRERRSSTCFGGDFAIPHSMYMDANTTAISVLVTDRGIPWGSSTVRLIILFALSPDGRRAFRDILEGITRLLSDRVNVSALLDTSDFDSFMTALERLLD